MAVAAAKRGLRQMSDDLVHQSFAVMRVVHGKTAQRIVIETAGCEQRFIFKQTAGIFQMAVTANAFALQKRIHLMLQRRVAAGNFTDIPAHTSDLSA